jgi:starch phosphorylase
MMRTRTMILQKLGYTNLDTYHLNEGHSAFLVFELLKKYKTIGEVKKHCVFTTHTPVEAGHERFDYDVVKDIFRDRLPEIVYSLAGKENLNMTKLALNSSRYINGVSRKHGEVSAMMFPGYQVKSITNGIHVNTWVSKHLEPVFDSSFGTRWRFDPACLEGAIEINEHDIWHAHDLAKTELLDYERSHSSVHMDKDVLTISYARRMTAYKRPMLIFTDLERLAKIARGKIQFIFAGKSHPADMNAKAMIKHLHEYSDTLWDSYRIKFAYLSNYDMDLDKMLTTGSDVWLNNPRRYNEASGTSGMKAALNGVLNFSTLDGWWIEGYEQDPLSGWAIGPGPSVPDADKLPDSADADALYKVLEDEILPIWRKNINDWKVRMKHAVRLAAYFNTNRMVEEYAVNAFRLKRIIPWTSA